MHRFVAFALWPSCLEVVAASRTRDADLLSWRLVDDWLMPAYSAGMVI